MTKMERNKLENVITHVEALDALLKLMNHNFIPNHSAELKKIYEYQYTQTMSVIKELLFYDTWHYSDTDSI